MRSPVPIATVPILSGVPLSSACLVQGLASHTSPHLNAIRCKVSFLLAVRTDVRWFISVHGSKSGCSGARLFGASLNDGIFLLEATEDGVGSERGGVHRGVKGRLQVF